MKALWVVNKYCGAMHEKVFGSKSTGGLWLDSMLEQAKKTNDKIVVVNISNSSTIKHLVDENIFFYTVTGSPNEKYNYYGKSELDEWKEIIDKEKPDIIELWGTEFPYGLSTLKVAPNIPHLVYVQGILGAIGDCYTAGLSKKEFKEATTIRDILTHNKITEVGERYKKRSSYEKEIVSKAGNVIIANDWAENYYSKNCPGVKFYRMPINITNCFSNYSWSEEIMQPHTIMCPAADYPIKGLHMLLKALKIVKEKYLDTKLYIPGTKLRRADSIANLIKLDGYSKLIGKMLRDYNLEESVIYTGRLTAEEMAKRMSKVNCFVMCSAVENHASTLLEAMTVGAPCVAANVGGVPEYTVNEKNALTYDFDDYESLAHNIIRIFEDKQLRNKLSMNAKEIKNTNGNDELDYQKMKEIYKKVIENVRDNR